MQTTRGVSAESCHRTTALLGVASGGTGGIGAMQAASLSSVRWLPSRWSLGNRQGHMSSAVTSRSPLSVVDRGCKFSRVLGSGLVITSVPWRLCPISTLPPALFLDNAASPSRQSSLCQTPFLSDSRLPWQTTVPPINARRGTATCTAGCLPRVTFTSPTTSPCSPCQRRPSRAARQRPSYSRFALEWSPGGPTQRSHESMA